jgi:fatty acid desaturase
MNMDAATQRDYGLLGADGQQAAASGLAQADWFRATVDRKRMKQLMQRSDGRAIFDTLLWFALLAVFGVAGTLTWGTWKTVPLWFCYGVLYSMGGDSRCHEAGHGTAFKPDG